jgi:hypothetical protein
MEAVLVLLLYCFVYQIASILHQYWCRKNFYIEFVWKFNRDGTDWFVGGGAKVEILGRIGWDLVWIW